ncbi:MAG: DUF4245 domain-containing protein [Actinobacteria bacterium]|nr:DUF4245 domain-containing protein [Actinomycetota bacterium]
MTVSGEQWAEFPSRRADDRTIVRTDGAVTYILSGSAGLDELKTLAAALR